MSIRPAKELKKDNDLLRRTSRLGTASAANRNMVINSWDDIGTWHCRVCKISNFKGYQQCQSCEYDRDWRPMPPIDASYSNHEQLEEAGHGPESSLAVHTARSLKRSFAARFKGPLFPDPEHCFPEHDISFSPLFNEPLLRERAVSEPVLSGHMPSLGFQSSWTKSYSGQRIDSWTFGEHTFGQQQSFHELNPGTQNVGQPRFPEQGSRDENLGTPWYVTPQAVPVSEHAHAERSGGDCKDNQMTFVSGQRQQRLPRISVVNPYTPLRFTHVNQVPRILEELNATGEINLRYISQQYLSNRM